MTIAFDSGISRNPFNYQKIEQISRDVTTTWIPLTTVADQLNLYGDTSQDDLLYGLELAARMMIEDHLGISIFPTGYRIYYGVSAMTSPDVTLDLPVSTVSVDAVKYWNSGNTLTTVATNGYYFDASGPKIVVTSPPSDLNNTRTNPIYAEVTQAASNLADYPTVQQASLLLLMHLYNNRSETHDKIMRRIPIGVDYLLRPYKDLVL